MACFYTPRHACFTDNCAGLRSLTCLSSTVQGYPANSGRPISRCNLTLFSTCFTGEPTLLLFSFLRQQCVAAKLKHSERVNQCFRQHCCVWRMIPWHCPSTSTHQTSVEPKCCSDHWVVSSPGTPLNVRLSESGKETNIPCGFVGKRVWTELWRWRVGRGLKVLYNVIPPQLYLCRHTSWF